MPEFIATLLFKRNPGHKPSNKITRACPAALVCTDATGAHHSILLHASSYTEAQDIAEEVGKKMASFVHVTRVESVGFAYQKQVIKRV